MYSVAVKADGVDPTSSRILDVLYQEVFPDLDVTQLFLE
jgi:hypothetical protein